MINLFITGGLGYIATHILHTLNKNYNILIYDNLVNSDNNNINYIKTLNLHITIITTKYELEKVICDFKPDVFLHMASLKYVNESCEEPIMYYDNNISEMLYFIKQVIIKAKCKKIIFSSSATVYKSKNDQVDETTDLQNLYNFDSVYGKTKCICENILMDIQKKYNLEIIILRYFNPIGYLNNEIMKLFINRIENTLMSNILTAYSKNKKFNIYGNKYDTIDGTPIRDFIHIMDLATAHSEFITKSIKPCIKIYNVGTGIGTTVKQIIDEFNNITNPPLKYGFTSNRKGDIPISFSSNVLIIKDTSWKPKYSIKDIVENVSMISKYLFENNY